MKERRDWKKPNLRKIPSWPKCLVNWVEKSNVGKRICVKMLIWMVPQYCFTFIPTHPVRKSKKNNRNIHKEAKAEGSSPDNFRVTIETWRDGWSNRGMCECWRHTATYLTYWLCVKSHPLNMAARCVAMVIYTRAPTLTLHAAVGNIDQCCIHWLFFSQRSLPSARYNKVLFWEKCRVIAYCRFMVKTLNKPFCCVFFFFYCSGQQAWSRISRRLPGQDTYSVLKMS